MSSTPDVEATAETGKRSLVLHGVKVLMYHRVVADEALRADKYDVPRSSFAWCLDEITRGGHAVLPLAAVCRFDGTVSERGVVLSFDDGRSSDYEIAFPELTAKVLRAEFFVNPSTIGKAGFLSWAQVSEMGRAGFSFQSHSRDHVALPLLSSSLLAAQLRESKREIEDRTGKAVDVLAAPYGLVNRRVIESALSEGYLGVCTSWSWPARPGARRIGRIAVLGSTSRREFGQLLRGDPRPYVLRGIRSALLHLPRQALLRLRPARLGVQVLEGHA
jgi:peptidoglycan/xylan/chitin deacetylase (PgdA/CDA1 family)